MIKWLNKVRLFVYKSKNKQESNASYFLVGCRKITRQYREAIISQAQKQWGVNNSRTLSIKNRIDCMDVDYIHGLQLGGIDHLSNLSLLDKFVKRSIGLQLHAQLAKLSEGTKITNITEKGN